MTTTDKTPKKRSINLQAGALANNIVTLRARVQRHDLAMREAKHDLDALEKDSDPTVLAMAKALLSATVTPPDPPKSGKGDGEKAGRT